MEIAVVGADARLLCRKACLRARCFRAGAEAAGRSWDLLALARDAAGGAPPEALRARSILLPGDSDPAFARGMRALQLIGYGFSPRDTLTLSSFAEAGRLLCLQRSIVAADGTLLEPQELPLPPAFAAFSDEDALLAAGVLLLTSARS